LNLLNIRTEKFRNRSYKNDWLKFEFSHGMPQIDQWRHTNPTNPPSQASIRSVQSMSKLPDIALQGKPGGSPKRQAVTRRAPPPRENSNSRIPRYTAERNQQYSQLHQLNAKAQKDINEINRQIKLYKKLNRSQR